MVLPRYTLLCGSVRRDERTRPTLLVRKASKTVTYPSWLRSIHVVCIVSTFPLPIPLSMIILFFFPDLSISSPLSFSIPFYLYSAFPNILFRYLCPFPSPFPFSILSNFPHLPPFIVRFPHLHHSLFILFCLFISSAFSPFPCSIPFHIYPSFPILPHLLFMLFSSHSLPCSSSSFIIVLLSTLLSLSFSFPFPYSSFRFLFPCHIYPLSIYPSSFRFRFPFLNHPAPLTGIILFPRSFHSHSRFRSPSF